MSVVRWTIGLAVMAICAAQAMAQSSIQTAFNYNLDDAPAAAAPAEEKKSDEGSTGCCESSSDSCCSEASCGCENGCCNSCGCGAAILDSARTVTAW